MKRKDGKCKDSPPPRVTLVTPALPDDGDERRRYHQAREVFEYAFAMLEPMLNPDAGWQGRSLHHVSFNLVSENFPHLGHDEVHALLDAVKRVFGERGSSGSDDLAPEVSLG